MMMWSVETDDFKGLCGEKYPLLKAINRALRSGVVSEPPKIKEEKNQPDMNNESDNQESNDIFGQDNYEDNESDVDDHYEEPNYVQEQLESNDVCKEEGFVRDPKSPETFYYCQFLNGQYNMYTYHCPSGLVYDSCSKVCNWPNAAKSC